MAHHVAPICSWRSVQLHLIWPTLVRLQTQVLGHHYGWLFACVTSCSRVHVQLVRLPFFRSRLNNAWKSRWFAHWLYWFVESVVLALIRVLIRQVECSTARQHGDRVQSWLHWCICLSSSSRCQYRLWPQYAMGCLFLSLHAPYKGLESSTVNTLWIIEWFNGTCSSPSVCPSLAPHCTASSCNRSHVHSN